MRPLATIIALALAVLTGASCGAPPSDPVEDRSTAPDRWIDYRSARLGVSFRYPDRYLLVEGGAAAPAGGADLLLVEDTPEHRALVAGQSPEPREGPPAIALEVFPIAADLSAEDWVRRTEASNFRLAEPGSLGPVELAGGTAVTYRWDGLYAGRSVVAARAGRIYMWSVTWLDTSDALVRDFPRILDTVTFD